MFESKRLDERVGKSNLGVHITEDNVTFLSIIDDVISTVRLPVFHVVGTGPGCVVSSNSEHGI